MNGFHITKLEADERIVFGPVTTVKTTASTVGAGVKEDTMNRLVSRTVGITDRRVIVESADGAITMPNRAVRTVIIKRHVEEDGTSNFTLLRLNCANGQVIRMDIADLGLEDEARLAATFPNARIKESRGLLRSLLSLVGFSLLSARRK